MLGLVLPWWSRWAVLAVALVAAAAFGAAKMHAHDQIKYDALEAKFEAFKDTAAALGREAKAAAAAREAADKSRKEAADAENSAALATLASDIAKLRARRASSGFLPAPGSAATSLDRVSVKRAELERALRELDTGVQGLFGEGDRAIVDLNSAKKWAHGHD
jgi:hypothetical protein